MSPSDGKAERGHPVTEVGQLSPQSARSRPAPPHPAPGPRAVLPKLALRKVRVSARLGPTAHHCRAWDPEQQGHIVPGWPRRGGQWLFPKAGWPLTGSAGVCAGQPGVAVVAGPQNPPPTLP